MRVRHHGADLPNANLLAIQTYTLLAEERSTGESSTTNKHRTATGKARTAQTTALNTMSNKRFTKRYPAPPGLGAGTVSSGGGTQKSPRFATRERVACSSLMPSPLARSLDSATDPSPFDQFKPYFLDTISSPTRIALCRPNMSISTHARRLCRSIRVIRAS